LKTATLARLSFAIVDVAEVVNTYVGAWHERDEATRRRMLEATWADEGVYTDPGGTIEGREAIMAAIVDFQERRPGVRIEVRSAVDGFDRHFRFVWATVDAAGTVLREGIDVGQLGEDGRIESIVAFLGVTP
jgi:SnoaL-like domain